MSRANCLSCERASIDNHDYRCTHGAHCEERPSTTPFPVAPTSPTMTAEEALYRAMVAANENRHTTIWTGAIVEHLASLGYAIRPITTTLDDDAVEKAARELCRKRHTDGFGADIWRDGELDAKVDAYWRRHEPDARAAITAYKQATGE